MGKVQAIEQRQPIVNGINVDDVKALIEAVKQDPRTGLTQWKVTSAWQGRTHIRAQIGPFHIGGKTVKRPFTIDIDEPMELGGSNAYPNPQEHLIAALNACMMIGYVALCTVTVMTLASLGLLVAGLPSHKETPLQLLISAACLWASNVLIFASWYWRLDAGGPHQRDLRGAHTDGAFLFPQMMLDLELREQMGEQDWRPGFVDYLFLAFNTSTAFSPTDVPVLSRWAKVLMMLQAAISLATLAILAARAVNIL